MAFVQIKLAKKCNKIFLFLSGLNAPRLSVSIVRPIRSVRSKSRFSYSIGSVMDVSSANQPPTSSVTAYKMDALVFCSSIINLFFFLDSLNIHITPLFHTPELYTSIDERPNCEVIIYNEFA
jgi:hypothetical protein